MLGKLKSTLLKIFLFSILCLLSSCLVSTSRQARTIHYRHSLRPYKIIQNLNKGDSVLLVLGDTIPYKVSLTRKGFEKGQILVKRNIFNKIEFYELGVWTDNRPSGLVTEGFFTKESGLLRHKQWQLINNQKYLLSDWYRFHKNDSLVEVQNWYIGFEKIQYQMIYHIKRGHRKKHPDFERRENIGTWKYYTTEGVLKKKKFYTNFELTE